MTAGTYEHAGPKDATGNDLAKFLQQAGNGGPWRRLILKEDAEYQVERGLVARGLSFCEVEQNGAKLFCETTGAGYPSHDIDFQEWPRRRCVVRLTDAWAALWHSSRAGAMLHGGHGTKDWSLGYPCGVTYDKRYEAQHGFAFDHCRESVFDIASPDRKINHIEVRNTWGDLVNVGNYSAMCTTKGSENDMDALMRVWGHAGRGPGLHHCGRQGLNVDSGCWGNKFQHLPVWSVKRSWLDAEPGGGGTVQDTLVEDCLVGCFQGNWIASGGDGHVNGFTARRCHGNGERPMRVFAWDDPSDWNGKPKRRSNWTIDDISSEAIYGAAIPMMRFGLIDGVSVTNVRQKISDRQAGRGLYFEGCTGVVDKPNDFQLVH